MLQLSRSVKFGDQKNIFSVIYLTQVSLICLYECVHLIFYEVNSVLCITKCSLVVSKTRKYSTQI